MKDLNIENFDRIKTYNFFKNFSNSTYSCNVILDVTKLVNFSKNNSSSFFINMLYIVLKALNSIDEMRMRIVDNKPVIFDDINPAFTVMTQKNNFENVRHKNVKNYKEFYKTCNKKIADAKLEEKIKEEDYNPKNCFNEYYITCLPWINFSQFTHPIPDDIESQCIPRICWGKFIENNNKYELNLNITVSHIFVDGLPLSTAFLKIQELLNNVEEILI